MRLYKIFLKGSLERFNPAYVVADNTDEAYGLVKTWLDKKDYGFSGERALNKIEVIADEYEYSDWDRLFIKKKDKEAKTK